MKLSDIKQNEVLTLEKYIELTSELRATRPKEPYSWTQENFKIGKVKVAYQIGSVSFDESGEKKYNYDGYKTIFFVKSFTLWWHLRTWYMSKDIEKLYGI